VNENEAVDIGRAHSIQLDSTYFQQSNDATSTNNESFDREEVSVLDDSSDNDIGDDKTCMYFIASDTWPC
jgi:hypothetical protein